MKRSKHILFYTLSMAGCALLEVLLTVLFSKFPPSTLLASQLIYYFSRLLAVTPAFLMLGTAVAAIRARSFSSALLYFFIYTGIFLFAQLPLSLLAYAASQDVLYGVTLFSYMLSSALTSLLFFFILVLAHAIFLQGKRYKEAEGERFFSLSSGTSRAILLASLLLMAYNLVSEALSVLDHLKATMYILSGEDIFDILIAFLFILFLVFFCFTVGRLAERLYPSRLMTEEDTEADFEA